MEDVTPAMLRAQAEEALRPVAQRRVRLLEELLACEAELKPLVRRAVEVEISYRRITSLSGLSRPGSGHGVVH
ncbi:hypothetical protein ABTX60_36720 [Streptomyces sp. NPDC126510]|uniref:hypothetical protein n=1 Tax=Streptomyces sp. NPDC126510 TaxID=3155317 RepID=UPI0033214E13